MHREHFHERRKDGFCAARLGLVLYGVRPCGVGCACACHGARDCRGFGLSRPGLLLSRDDCARSCPRRVTTRAAKRAGPWTSERAVKDGCVGRGSGRGICGCGTGGCHRWCAAGGGRGRVHGVLFRDGAGEGGRNGATGGHRDRRAFAARPSRAPGAAHSMAIRCLSTCDSAMSAAWSACCSNRTPARRTSR